jgi:hypothetical protein
MLAYAASGESSTVRIQETVTIEIPGATAAYTTNPAIADAIIVRPGLLSITGQAAGTTQLMVITAAGTQAFSITVTAASNPAPARPAAGVPHVSYDARYSSGAARVQNTIDVSTTDDVRRSELHVVHIHDLLASRRESNSIASVFYRRTTPARVLTLLDDAVDVSRTTIANTQLRGVHLRQGPLDVHAGYASSAMYDSFFLPAERRWAAGAGYDIHRGATRWTPSVYGFFSAPPGTAARRGLVGALTVEHRESETLFMRGDVGVSRSIAAAGEIRHTTSRGHIRALVSVKPDDFPTLGLGDVRGDHAELDWSRRATDRLSLASYGTFDRFNLAGESQRIGGASFSLRYAATARLAFHGGASATRVRTPGTSLRTIGLPFGVTYEAPAYGAAASYRLMDDSSASRRGDSIRLSAHARRGRFSASTWAERQRQAPTLDLIFSAEPGLELALLRLGISVRNPEDVARALRDNAALIDLGFITGVNVDLTPRRLQAGFSAGWLGSGPRSDHIRILAIHGRDERISSTRDSTIATLTYSRRVLAATDLYGSLSWYRTTSLARPVSGTSVDLGFRQQFSGVPAFMRRAGTIEGFVFLDPEMRGVRGAKTTALVDVEVTLDGMRTVRTDAHGAFAFHKVSPGAHRVAARLPPSPRAFFSTPSSVATTGPAHVDFGIVWTAARIDGRVINDAGAAISGAVLSASTQDGVPISTTSDAEGRFVFAVPAGDFLLSLVTASLPPGYSIAGTIEQRVRVAPDQPQVMSFEVQALRSVTGRAPGAAEVRIESLDRTARVDAAGNFVFRQMPSGSFAITARIAGRAVSANIVMPSDPAMLHDVVLR